MSPYSSCPSLSSLFSPSSLIFYPLSPLVSLLLVFLLGGEFSSAFAKSVKIHVSSLIKGGKTVKSLYLPADADREKEIEREVEEIFITMAV